MKKILVIVFVLISTSMFSQDSKNDILEKYAFVEVWGLQNMSKEEFLTQITSYPEGICEQSLMKMGLLDGNKIPVAFSNKIIVTTRTIPNFKKFGIYKKLSQTKSIENNNWNKLVEDYKKLGNNEKQLLSFFIEPFNKNDQNGIDSIFLKFSDEYKSYGINLEKSKIVEAYNTYNKYSKLFTKDDVLSILYLAERHDPKFDAASFVASNYLRNSKDLLDFLPLLLRKKSGIQPVISSFLQDFNGKINWNKNNTLLTDLLNNPNPYQSILALKVADKTRTKSKHLKKLLNIEMLTMKEILLSNHLPVENRNYLIVFLNKYANESIETGVNFWVQKLK